jgi:predicted O-methyltransferase YrrM
MKGQLTSADLHEAGEVYHLFSSRPHSEHIATEFALAHLTALLRKHQIGSVLEFGAGIGTITYLLLSTLSENVIVECTEQDHQCLAFLEQNLTAEMRKRVVIHSDGLARWERPFDLVIIDGDVSPGSDFLDRKSICFAEGNRRKARTAIESSLSERGLTCPFTNHV